MHDTPSRKRAKTTNVRTREHLRRWGIADELRRASPIAPDRPSTVVFATRMNGPLITRFENALNGGRERNNLYSEEAHDNLVRLGGFLKPELAVAEREVAKVEIAA
jgi:hypothetical protein